MRSIPIPGIIVINILNNSLALPIQRIAFVGAGGSHIYEAAAIIGREATLNTAWS